MNCGRFREIHATEDLVRLSPEDRADFERHLDECAPCARAFREVLLTAEILKGLGPYEEAETPPPLPERLVQRILEARRARRAEDRKDRRAM